MKREKLKNILLVTLSAVTVAAAIAGCGNAAGSTAGSSGAGNSVTGNGDAAGSSVENNSTAGSSGTENNADENSGNGTTEVKVIKGVTGGSLAPYFYVDEDNNLTGVDIEIAQEVFNRLPQYELQIEIADALQGVLSGQYDIAINNYGYTEERAESYYFSYPYKTTYNEYIQRTDDEPLTSLQDIADRGYKIELGAGSLTANALEEWNAENPEHTIEIIYAETDFQVKFQHIIDGVTDVAIDDGPILDILLGKFGLEGQLVGNDIDPDTEDFLFPKNNTYFLFGKNEEGAALREDVNRVLKEMKEDGTLAEITEKYFEKDTSPKAEYFEETVN